MQVVYCALRVADMLELGMRPVRAPEQPVDAESGQQCGPGARGRREGRCRIPRFCAYPIRRRTLHPHAPRLAERDQVRKTRVADAERAIEAAEMIDHDPHAAR